MFVEFLNIMFRSLKLDKNLYKDNANFGEAAIYFAGLIMILDGVAGAVAANTIVKTAIGLSGLSGCDLLPTIIGRRILHVNPIPSVQKAADMPNLSRKRQFVRATLATNTGE